MAYTAEMLAALSDMDLDDMIEELVMDREPEPGLLQRIKRGAVRRLSRTGSDGEFPAYSSSHAGMGLVMEGMLAKGFTVAVAPGGVVWVAGNRARNQVCRRRGHASRGGDCCGVGGAGGVSRGLRDPQTTQAVSGPDSGGIIQVIEGRLFGRSLPSWTTTATTELSGEILRPSAVGGRRSCRRRAGEPSGR